MRKFFVLVGLTLMLVFIGEEIHAQQRFKAGLVLGLNASQLQGDDSAGYRKLGVQGGLRAITILKDRMDFIIEMLYSQRGSFDGNEILFPDGNLDINLQYVEVPVMISYKDWLDEEKGFYKLQATTGFTYSRLVEASASGSKHDNEVVNFNDNNYSFNIGVEYFAGPKFSLGARWTRSINLLFNNEKHNENLDALFGYFLSFRGVYQF